MYSLEALQGTISKKNHSNNRDIDAYSSIIHTFSGISKHIQSPM